ncbi:hypothetical protein EC973_007487 [Apophysomyces ossiformis]|uniref:SAP domain-containing protein n=1 Tax=Apophysomyces ossiformis TaxID=679940 RepID=A0A8H7BUP8_9FUNG|nr:hypothetical protein EC973_007487 [Apophysomyces ossiformis]
MFYYQQNASESLLHGGQEENDADISTDLFFDFDSYLNTPSPPQLPPWSSSPTEPPHKYQRRRSSSLSIKPTFMQQRQMMPIREEQTGVPAWPTSPPLSVKNSSVDLSPPTMLDADEDEREERREVHRGCRRRRRSSSVPPTFRGYQTPLIFAQLHVADPRPPIQPQAKDMRPIQIERVHHAPRQRPVTTEKEINFDDITVAELKERLRQLGLSATGKKADLIQRLRQALRPIDQHVAAMTISDTAPPLKNIKVEGGTQQPTWDQAALDSFLQNY